MAEYITAKYLEDFRDDIMNRFLSLCDYNDYKKLTLLRIGETIDEIYDKYCEKPLADVVEVRHGVWEQADNTKRGQKFICSVCKGVSYYTQPTRDKKWVKH